MVGRQSLSLEWAYSESRQSSEGKTRQTSPLGGRKRTEKTNVQEKILDMRECSPQ